ncbi:DNA ligase [Cohnella sp. AR92]|uniref:ATP-dependent DNA ligase n=1 Tax=Cohnella sp. AR92 TaxID=648716 RepID=UPI000F8F1250|nr:DNA ligase [Cohnella sp. AR92]RUS44956.1 DNA ligase [Cohnella sp. AR92]
MLNQPIKPMLLQPLPPEEIKQDWKSSIKWDGFRIIIHYDDGKVRAFTRHGTEVTDRFPELLNIKLPVTSAILDGECIAFDLTQTSDQPYKIWWDDAMMRFNTKKPAAVQQICRTLKAHFPVWDLLWINGKSVLHKTFQERRDLLQTLVQTTDILSVTPLYDNGEQLFTNVQQQGLEGIVQYNANSTYHLDSRPQDVIVKIKDYQYVTCQVSSIRKNSFGWGLQLEGKYVGVIEFPPHRNVIRAFHTISKQIIKGENKEWVFLEPILSCRVKYQCFTKDGKLRSPKFEEFCTV